LASKKPFYLNTNYTFHMEQNQMTELRNYTRTLVESELTSYEVIEALKKRGLSEEQATQAYNHVEEEYNAQMRKKGTTKMIIGILVLLVGTVVTVATANGKGGVIAYGAIIYGVINTVIGAKMRSDYA
jgi:hypothetical protein